MLTKILPQKNLHGNVNIHSAIHKSCLPVVALNGSPGVLVYITPLIRSDTLTLNWYCCPSCSPDTTPEEALAGKVIFSKLEIFDPLKLM